MCAEEPRCQFFVYVKPKINNRQLKRACFLKSSKGNAVAQEHFISGPKFCQENNNGNKGNNNGGNNNNNGKGGGSNNNGNGNGNGGGSSNSNSGGNASKKTYCYVVTRTAVRTVLYRLLRFNH